MFFFSINKFDILTTAVTQFVALAIESH